MPGFVSALVGKLLALLVAFLRGLVADRQARADAMDLGAKRAEAATDRVIDDIEAKQDAVDKVDRAGAAGVLDRLRRHSDGAAGIDR